MAVSDNAGTNSFLNDISQQMLNEGSLIANRLKAYFITTNPLMQKSNNFI